ncbi:MAG: protein kinase, partial [Planctomycetota bacterium]
MIDLGLVHREFPEIKEAARLGRGGFKEVFSGRHESDGLVVLKLILPGKQDTDQLAREVDACSSVDCDRVPRVYAHGQVDTELGALLWIREQRIVGQSLDDVLRQAPLSDRECMRMSLHVGGALAAAEQVNIVHRDVKPGNIMKDESGYWLLDFGIARHLDLESLTSTKAMWGKGTPGYAPPEQWRAIPKSSSQYPDSSFMMF